MGKLKFAKKDDKHWDINPIKRTKCNYRMVYSERGPGKSYAVKYDILENAVFNDEQFVYLRRREVEVKRSKIERFFADMDICTISNNEYDGMTVYGGDIYLTKFDNGKNVRSKKIGYTMAMSTWIHDKGGQYPFVNTILFDEWMIEGVNYLYNEPTFFMQLISTIFRDRMGTVWMLGNNDDITCPYFVEWGLYDIVSTLKRGQLVTTEVENPVTESVVSVAIEFADRKDKSGVTHGMIIGKKASKRIASGEWGELENAQIGLKNVEYEKVYELLFRTDYGSFIITYNVSDNGIPFTFIYPYHTSRKIERIIQTDIDFDNPLITQNFLSNKVETKILNCIKKNENLVYSSGQTARTFVSAFKQFYLTKQQK